MVVSSNEAYGVTLREDMTENVAYGVCQNEVEMEDNEAYTATATGGGAGLEEDGEKYDYVTRNEAYGIS